MSENEREVASLSSSDGEGRRVANDPLSLELRFDWSPVSENPRLTRHLRPQIDTLALSAAAQRCPETLIPLARRCWEARTRAEYVGVMLCRKLHGLLVDLNAPLDLQELALLMTLQEQQHSALCAQAAHALGSEGWIPCPLDELQQVQSTEQPEEELSALLWGTFLVGEFVALELLKGSVSALPTSPFRDILRALAKDEVLHGRLGLELLPLARSGAFDAWFPYPGDQHVQEIVTRFRQGMRRRDVVEEEELTAGADPHQRAALAELGLSAPEAFIERYHEALEVRLPEALTGVGFSLAAT